MSGTSQEPTNDGTPEFLVSHKHRLAEFRISYGNLWGFVAFGEVWEKFKEKYGLPADALPWWGCVKPEQGEYVISFGLSSSEFDVAKEWQKPPIIETWDAMNNVILGRGFTCREDWDARDKGDLRKSLRRPVCPVVFDEAAKIRARNRRKIREQQEQKQ